MKKSRKEFKPTKSELDLINAIFYSKTKRRRLKNFYLRIQKNILETSDFTKKPVLKEELAKRVEDVSDLGDSIGGLYLIKEAEKNDKEMQMINCRFKLFKKDRAYIIANTYESPHRKKKLNKTFHFMPNGLPLKNRKREIKYRNKFEFSDYELVDEGIFRQVFTQIRGSIISYKGKIYNFRIKYQGIGPNKKTYRIEMMRFEKR